MLFISIILIFLFYLFIVFFVLWFPYNQTISLSLYSHIYGRLVLIFLLLRFCFCWIHLLPLDVFLYMIFIIGSSSPAYSLMDENYYDMAHYHFCFFPSCKAMMMMMMQLHSLSYVVLETFIFFQTIVCIPICMWIISKIVVRSLSDGAIHNQ